MRASYHQDYFVPLPPGHPFPMAKFPVLRDQLVGEGLLHEADLVSPREADWSDLLLVHTPEYLKALADGTLSRQEERRMGLPWSEALVRRSRLAVQGTLNAGMMALEDGIAANLAGGTHHAFPGHGEGFCVLNDVAVAIRVLKRTRWIRRALVFDLDVHQGNGTAAIFSDDPDVCTVSVHGERNYPFRKVASTIDVGLDDGTEDAEYLEVVADLLPRALDRACPDVVFYLAGIDVMANDRFGRLALTREGLYRRDRLVVDGVRSAGIPIVMLLSGGYAQTPELTADLHATAHRAARDVSVGSGSE